MSLSIYEIRLQVVQMATGVLMRHWERETDAALASNASVPKPPSKESIRSYAEHLLDFIAPTKTKRTKAEEPVESEEPPPMLLG